MSELVSLSLDERDGVVVASLSGELDIAGAAKTGEEILAAVPVSARGLVVDFSHLEFIDSSGIAMLFRLVRTLRGRRQRVAVVAHADGPVARVLGLVEFERAAPIHPELEQALAAVTRP